MPDERSNEVYFEEWHAADEVPRLCLTAVAFLDLLGVSQLAHGDQAPEVLETLSTAMTRVRSEIAGGDATWPSLQSPTPGAVFSDSIVFATPVIDGMDPDFAVTTVLSSSAQLQMRLMQHGYALRGAMALGDLHHSAQLTFGRALVDAHRLEETLKGPPRIVVSAEVLQVLEHAYKRDPSSLMFQLLIDPSDGYVFVDYLSSAVTEYMAEDADAILIPHRKRLEKRLSEHHGKPTLKKFEWLAGYHNWVTANRLSNNPEALVTGVEPGQFVSFGPGTGRAPEWPPNA